MRAAGPRRGGEDDQGGEQARGGGDPGDGPGAGGEAGGFEQQGGGGEEEDAEPAQQLVGEVFEAIECAEAGRGAGRRARCTLKAWQAMRILRRNSSPEVETEASVATASAARTMRAPAQRMLSERCMSSMR